RERDAHLDGEEAPRPRAACEAIGGRASLARPGRAHALGARATDLPAGRSPGAHGRAHRDGPCRSGTRSRPEQGALAARHGAPQLWTMKTRFAAGVFALSLAALGQQSDPGSASSGQSNQHKSKESAKAKV